MFHKCFFNSLVVLKNSISEIFYHNMPDSNLRLVQNLVSEVMRQILCKLLTIIQESWYSNGKNHIPHRNVALYLSSNKLLCSLLKFADELPDFLTTLTELNFRSTRFDFNTQIFSLLRRVPFVTSLQLT